MKKKIHPNNYRLVVFKDLNNEELLMCKSTVQTKETIKIKNEEYPLYKMEVSSFSHPFFTGKMKYIDTAGQIEKFKSKYASFKKIKK